MNVKTENTCLYNLLFTLQYFFFWAIIDAMTIELKKIDFVAIKNLSVTATEQATSSQRGLIVKYPGTKESVLGEKERETVILFTCGGLERGDQVSTLGLKEGANPAELPLPTTTRAKSEFSDVLSIYTLKTLTTVYNR